MKKILYPAVLVVTLGIGVLLMYSIWGAVAPRSAAQFQQSESSISTSRSTLRRSSSFKCAAERCARSRSGIPSGESLPRSRRHQFCDKALRTLLDYFPDDAEASGQLGNIYLQGGVAILSFSARRRSSPKRCWLKYAEKLSKNQVLTQEEEKNRFWQ